MEISLRVSGIEGRMLALGLPRYLTKPLALEVVKYAQNSGPAWTVGRLKSLKNDLVLCRAGHSPLTWVKKNRRGGWYGVWGALLNYASKSDKCFGRAVSALMVYSRFVPDAPTEEHVKKFRASVGAPRSFIPQGLLTDLGEHAHQVVGRLTMGKTPPLVQYEGHPSVKAPIYGGSSVPQDDYHELEMRWTGEFTNCLFMATHHKVYDGVFAGLRFNPERAARPWLDRSGTLPSWWDPTQVSAGKVVPLTKDGGWKVRWIASPYRIHQLALQPLGGALFSALRSLPWDCTFDQSKAIPSIQKHLAEGRCAHAVDLTSATDFFPLELQLAVLRAVVPESEHVDLFEALSRARWDSPYGEVSWSRGQPMGLYPSFAAFALTHGILLDLLSGGRPGLFFVLGDDVVILDERLHQRYVQVLDLLECPRDPVKSISSTELTEFAGKIITRDLVIPQYKWRDVSDDSFLDMMRAFGQRFERLLTQRQRTVYREVAELLPPQGCGHSHGASRPLEEVVSATEEFKDLCPERSARRLHTSFLSWVSQVLKPGRSTSLFWGLDVDWAQNETAHLDERVRSAFFDTPFAPWRGAIPSAVTDVLQFTAKRADLPAQGPGNWAGRETVLSYYERVLANRKPA